MTDNNANQMITFIERAKHNDVEEGGGNATLLGIVGPDNVNLPTVDTTLWPLHPTFTDTTSMAYTHYKHACGPFEDNSPPAAGSPSKLEVSLRSAEHEEMDEMMRISRPKLMVLGAYYDVEDGKATNVCLFPFTSRFTQFTQLTSMAARTTAIDEAFSST